MGPKTAESLSPPLSAANSNVPSLDAHIGARIKQRRIELRMSPKDLARALNLSLEQLIMLEGGEVPVTCRRLYETSRVLRAPMLWFFEGAPGIDLTLDLSQSPLTVDSSKQT
jgi:transcriptional regulator with XRE-family HTH domain